MVLASGTRLGPYEILAALGAGGMGEVYEARDTRLDRIVAVKVSAERFSARFEREARAVAALNHPHICALYDVGPDFLVMEYVDGRPVWSPDSAQMPTASTGRRPSTFFENVSELVENPSALSGLPSFNTHPIGLKMAAGFFSNSSVRNQSRISSFFL